MQYVLRMTREELCSLDYALKIARSERNQRLDKTESRRFSDLHHMINTAMMHPEDLKSSEYSDKDSFVGKGQDI